MTGNPHGPEPTNSPFAFLELGGARFDAVGMPAETAKEVGFLREAILEMARTVWRERHPGRRNVDPGFAAAFDLRLTKVEEGSARPQLLLRRPTSGPGADHWDEWLDIYAAARDRVTTAIGEVSADATYAQDLSRPVRSALAKVGSSLSDEELTTVGHPLDPNFRVILDARTRQVLKSIDDVLPEQPRPVSVTGVVVEYDGASLSFRLRTEDSGVATCTLEQFNDPLARFVRDVLALDGVTAPDVSVQGVTLDIERKPLSVFDVHAVTLVRSVDQKMLVSRMNQLSELQAGWWGPDSQAPTREVLEKLQLLLDRLAGLGVAVDLIPVGDGSVSIETRRGSYDLTASVEPGNSMLLVRDNVESDELAETESDFDADRLIDFLVSGATE